MCVQLALMWAGRQSELPVRDGAGGGALQRARQPRVRHAGRSDGAQPAHVFERLHCCRCRVPCRVWGGGLGGGGWGARPLDATHACNGCNRCLGASRQRDMIASLQLSRAAERPTNPPSALRPPPSALRPHGMCGIVFLGGAGAVLLAGFTSSPTWTGARPPACPPPACLPAKEARRAPTYTRTHTHTHGEADEGGGQAFSSASSTRWVRAAGA
jgi:hypothetical protein